MPEPGRWNGRGPNTEILQCLDPVRTTSSRRSDSKWQVELHTVFSTQYLLTFANCEIGFPKEPLLLEVRGCPGVHGASISSMDAAWEAAG